MGYTTHAITITKMDLKCSKTSLKNDFVLTDEWVSVESDEAEHSPEIYLPELSELIFELP